jgi:hypothetical protein
MLSGIDHAEKGELAMFNTGGLARGLLVLHRCHYVNTLGTQDSGMIPSNHSAIDGQSYDKASWRNRLIDHSSREFCHIRRGDPAHQNCILEGAKEAQIGLIGRRSHSAPRPILPDWRVGLFEFHCQPHQPKIPCLLRQDGGDGPRKTH